MPCYSSPQDSAAQDQAQAARDRAQRKKLEAVLCGVFRFVETKLSIEDFLYTVNWNEVGVSKEWALEWWRNHKEQDARREQAEVRRKQEKEDRERAEYERLKAKYG